MWLHKAITTVLGLGMAPKAPGTFGALGAVLFLFIAQQLGWHIATLHLTILIIFLTLLGVWSTSKVSLIWGDDPSKVVIDEFVGVLVSLLFLPLSAKNILLAFALFRFFDILKPLGIRYLDKNIKGAWGVMLDDVLAGVYTCITLHILNSYVL